MKNRNDLKENLDLAYKFFKNKNFEKAENLYKKILKKFPKSFDANYTMASIKAQKNNFYEKYFHHFFLVCNLLGIHFHQHHMELNLIFQ